MKKYEHVPIQHYIDSVLILPVSVIGIKGGKRRIPITLGVAEGTIMAQLSRPQSHCDPSRRLVRSSKGQQRYTEHSLRGLGNKEPMTEGNERQVGNMRYLSDESIAWLF